METKIKEKENKVIYKILDIATFIVFIVLMLNIIASKSDKIFELVGYRNYTVLSGSMEPEFYPGDLIAVKHKNKTDIKLGDVITYRDGDGVVITHRIIEETEEGYITKGDNNNVEDSYVVKDEDIIGEVKFSIPKVGYLLNFLSKPIVVAVVMVLLAGYIFITAKGK